MSEQFETTLPSDISLLLRADAEQCWLHSEVIPVLRDLEMRELLPEDEVGAALAYLETTWNEAMLRARATDAAHADLRSAARESLSGPAGRYHAAVRVLRDVVAERIRFAGCPTMPPQEPFALTCSRTPPAQTARSSRPL